LSFQSQNVIFNRISPSLEIIRLILHDPDTLQLRIICLFGKLAIMKTVGFTAQRLAAQAHGNIRGVVTILAGNLHPQFGVLSLSLGQSLPSRIARGGRLQSLVGRRTFHSTEY
jgi:hypothetical protein